MKGFLQLFLIAGVCLWGVYMTLPAYANFNKTQRDLQVVDRSLLQQQQMREGLQDEIRRLQVDPRATERVAREKFGWSRDGEIIYDFTD